MKVEMDIEVARYFLLFLPVASYKRCGEIAITRLLGVPIYKRVGSIRWCLGRSWVAGNG